MKKYILLLLSISILNIHNVLADEPPEKWWTELHEKIDLSKETTDFISNIVKFPEKLKQQKDMFDLGQLYGAQSCKCFNLMKTVNQTDVEDYQVEECQKLRDDIDSAIKDLLAKSKKKHLRNKS